MSAVSKKLIPSSRARRMNGRLSSSSSTHCRHDLVPYVMHPRQTRETFVPADPRLTNSITMLLACARSRATSIGRKYLSAPAEPATVPASAVGPQLTLRKPRGGGEGDER